MTVTGRTLKENLDGLPGLKAGQKIIQPWDKPIKATGHLQVLRGNLAPLGSVAKITGKEGTRFEGGALVYDSEEEMLLALAGKVPPELRERAQRDVAFARVVRRLPSITDEELRRLSKNLKIPPADQ